MAPELTDSAAAAALDSIIDAQNQAEAAAETQEPPQSDETPAEAEASVSEDDGDEDLPEGDTFERSYVEKLRKESAGYRQRAKKYEAVFSKYTDDDQQVLLQMAEQLASDPVQGTKYMDQIVQKLKEQYLKEQIEAAPEDSDGSEEDDVPLTKREVEAMLQEMKQKEAQERAVLEVQAEAKDLGYNTDSDDYVMLLHLAQKSKTGSLEDAHKALQAQKQKIIDDYLAEKEQDASGAKTPGGTGQVPSQEREIKSFKDAENALAEMLKAEGH